MTSTRDDPAANSLHIGIGKDFFQEAFAQSTVAMSAISPDKIFQAINPAACMLLGYGVTELRGKPFADILHPADLSVILAALDRLAQGAMQDTPNDFHLNCSVIHKSGRIIHVRMHMSPVRDVHGALACFFSQIFEAAEPAPPQEIDAGKGCQRSILFDNFPHLAWLKDTQNRFLAVNQPFVDAFGLASADDFVGKTDMDICPQDLAQQYQRDDQEVLASGCERLYEQMIEIQGVRKWFETYKAPVWDANGKLHGSVGFARDISRRRQTERHLALVDFALNQVNDSLFLIDKDARFLYVNDAACQALNYSRAELLEMSLPDIDPDWPAARWPEYFNNLKISGARKFETRHKTKDGHIFPVEVNSKYFEYLGCSYKVSVARDITDSKQVEELLSKRELEFRTLAENLPDLVVRYDRNCRRTYVNPAYERETGIPARHSMNEIPDAKWRTSISGEEYNAALKKVMATKVPAQIFIKATKTDQQLTDYVFHIVAECNPDGEVAGALAIGKNITVLKETQRRLEESQLLLRQLAARNETAREDERRHLSREIHDELGQCLSALRMNMSVLGLQCKDDNGSLQATIRRMITLVDSTIQVVRNLVTSLRPSALDMGIVPALEWLVEEFSNGHPDIHCTWYVAEEDIHLDEKRATEIFRIAQESLTNISRHAGATKVRIALERKDGRYLLEVRDNGRGFDPSQRKKQSFGLLGVRERVLMLGGEIAISSVPDQETIIKVGIPVHNVQKN
jgi:PAS domain S-box-containing protein